MEWAGQERPLLSTDRPASLWYMCSAPAAYQPTSPPARRPSHGSSYFMRYGQPMTTKGRGQQEHRIVKGWMNRKEWPGKMSVQLSRQMCRQMWSERYDEDRSSCPSQSDLSTKCDTKRPNKHGRPDRSPSSRVVWDGWKWKAGG